MANRAERRARAKAGSRGVPQQYDNTNGRGRGGMLDEYELQERSRRLIENNGEEWRPSGTVDDDGISNEPSTGIKLLKAPHSIRQTFRVISWVIIALAAISFLVVMWLPAHPTWLIITISAVFAVGVLSLFFVAGDAKHNPNLDGNGTAV